MYPTQHAAAALGVVTPLVGRGWQPSALALFAAAAVLLDTDHYVSYVWATGDLSLPNAYRYHCARAGRSRWGVRLRLPALLVDVHRPWHSVAALALLLAVAWRWPRLRPLAWGALFHRFQDFAWECFHVPNEVDRLEARLDVGAGDGVEAIDTLADVDVVVRASGTLPAS